MDKAQNNGLYQYGMRWVSSATNKYIFLSGVMIDQKIIHNLWWNRRRKVKSHPLFSSTKERTQTVITCFSFYRELRTKDIVWVWTNEDNPHVKFTAKRVRPHYWCVLPRCQQLSYILECIACSIRTYYLLEGVLLYALLLPNDMTNVAFYFTGLVIIFQWVNIEQSKT